MVGRLPLKEDILGSSPSPAAKVGSIEVTYVPRYSPDLLFSQSIPAECSIQEHETAERRFYVFL